MDALRDDTLLGVESEDHDCIENIAIIIRKCNHAHLYLLYITYEIYMQKSSKRDNSISTKTGVEED